MGPAFNILKWLGIAFGRLVGVLVIAILVVYFIAGSRLKKNMGWMSHRSQFLRTKHRSSVAAISWYRSDCAPSATNRTSGAR